MVGESIGHEGKCEGMALQQLSSMHRIKVENCGLFIEERYPFLGSSSDGTTKSYMPKSRNFKPL